MPGGPDTNDTKFKCLVTAFDIKKGIATNTALLFETEKIVIKGGGKINLQDETIDMQIEPKPKDASLLSLAVPIDIGRPGSRQEGAGTGQKEGGGRPGRRAQVHPAGQRLTQSS